VFGEEMVVRGAESGGGRRGRRRGRVVSIWPFVVGGKGDICFRSRYAGTGKGVKNPPVFYDFHEGSSISEYL